MIERLPILPNPKPRCFGISCDSRDVTCSVCPYRFACSQACEKWETTKSLAEIAQEAQAIPDSKDKDGDIDPENLYRTLYERCLGVKPPLMSSKAKLTLMRVQRFCEEREIDFGMYIASNMHGCKDWCMGSWGGGKMYGFQVNLLQGEKALARYNMHVRQMSRQLHYTESDAIEGADDNLRNTVMRAEISVGAMIVAATLIGRECFEQEAAEKTCAPFEWESLFIPFEYLLPEARTIHLDLVHRHGANWIKQFAIGIRLGAAVAVVERYRHGLSEQIGINGDLSWVALGQLIASIIPVVPSITSNLQSWLGGESMGVETELSTEEFKEELQCNP